MITNNGNVGIGTTNPVQKLDVAGTVNAQAFTINGQPLNMSGGSAASASDGVFSGLVQSTAVGNSYFTGGRVGIGTTNPTQKMDVAGTVNAQNYLLNGQPFSGGSSSSQWTTSGSNIYYNAGNVCIGTNIPRQALDIKGLNPTISLFDTSDDASAPRSVSLSVYGLFFTNRLTDPIEHLWHSGIYQRNGTLNIDAAQLDLRFHTHFADDAMVINPVGRVGIGTTAPRSRLSVLDVDKPFTNNDANLSVMTGDSQAVDKGGSMDLGGNADVPVGFARLVGRKENATANNRDGY